MKHIRRSFPSLLQQGIVLLRPSFGPCVNHLHQKLIATTGDDYCEHGTDGIGQPGGHIIQSLLNAFDDEPAAHEAFGKGFPPAHQWRTILFIGFCLSGGFAEIDVGTQHAN